MATTNKKQEPILIQIDNEIIELKDAELEAFEADRKQMREEQALLEAEYKKKEEARKSALEKLAEIAGLTKDEMAALGL